MKVFVTTIDGIAQLSERAEQFAQCDYLFDYSFFVDALAERGATISKLCWQEYDLFIKEQSPASLIQPHFDSDLIIHNPLLFQESLRFVLNEQGLEAADAEVKQLEHRVNNALYTLVPEKSHGVTVPPHFSREDFRFKDNLPRILRDLHVPTPRMVDGSSFPYMLKHKRSCRGRDVYQIHNNTDLLAAFAQMAQRDQPLEDFILQELIQIPTRAPSYFRVICYGPAIVGSAIYYAPPFRSTALVLDEKQKIGQEEFYLLHAYGMKEPKLPSAMATYAQRIGAYAAAHGTKLVAMDFVVDKNGTSYCVDINRDPGLEFFAVKGCTNDIEAVKKIAGGAYAEAAFQNVSRKTRRALAHT